MAQLSLSVFSVIGPPMIGPSSSHTAGAARIGQIARSLFGRIPQSVCVHLHGSFWATGRGHATDRAIISGVLGRAPDDAQLPQSLEQAAAQGIHVSFQRANFGDMAHPNTARLELSDGKSTLAITGASLGGGIVEIVEIDGYPTSFHGDQDTLICWHIDERGFLAHITSVCADAGNNIASLRTTRMQRGGEALTIVEGDTRFDDVILSRLRQVVGLRALICLAPLK